AEPEQMTKNVLFDLLTPAVVRFFRLCAGSLFDDRRHDCTHDKGDAQFREEEPPQFGSQFFSRASAALRMRGSASFLFNVQPEEKQRDAEHASQQQVLV